MAAQKQFAAAGHLDRQPQFSLEGGRGALSGELRTPGAGQYHALASIHAGGHYGP